TARSRQEPATVAVGPRDQVVARRGALRPASILHPTSPSRPRPAPPRPRPAPRRADASLRPPPPPNIRRAPAQAQDHVRPPGDDVRRRRPRPGRRRLPGVVQELAEVGQGAVLHERVGVQRRPREVLPDGGSQGRRHRRLLHLRPHRLLSKFPERRQIPPRRQPEPTSVPPEPRTPPLSPRPEEEGRRLGHGDGERRAHRRIAILDHARGGQRPGRPRAGRRRRRRERRSALPLPGDRGGRRQRRAVEAEPRVLRRRREALRRRPPPQGAGRARSVRGSPRHGGRDAAEGRGDRRRRRTRGRPDGRPSPRAEVAGIRPSPGGDGVRADPGGRLHPLRDRGMGRPRRRRRGRRGGATEAAGTARAPGGGVAQATGRQPRGRPRDAGRSPRRGGHGARERLVRVQAQPPHERRGSGIDLLPVRTRGEGGDRAGSGHGRQPAVRVRGIRDERGVQRGVSEDGQRPRGRSEDQGGFLPKRREGEGRFVAFRVAKLKSVLVA
ncbi:hypothetical protein ACHAWF_018845, partial [Thalassiosira exigua]